MMAATSAIMSSLFATATKLVREAFSLASIFGYYAIHAFGNSWVVSIVSRKAARRSHIYPKLSMCKPFTGYFIY